MPTVHFLGRVLPEPALVNVSYAPLIKWEAPELNLTMEFTIHVANSKIDVECKLNTYDPELLVSLYMRALDLCRAPIDLVAFKFGWGLSVVLEYFVDPSGATIPIVAKDESLAALSTSFTLDNGFDLLCAKTLESVPLFMALRDLIAAITVPHVSPVNCARAMDRLKHLIASEGSSDGEAWRQLREALQIDETYLKYITSHSVNPRHGRPGHTPGTVTTEVTRRSWIVMNRYFEYLKRGSTTLPLNEFPLLK
jgi:hypothetical protein